MPEPWDQEVMRGVIPFILEMLRDQNLPEWKRGRVGIDRGAFDRKLQIALDKQPRSTGSPPAPSDLNQWIDAMSGRTSPPSRLQGIGNAGDILNEFLQVLLSQDPINAGPPPGPTQAPADPPLPPPGPLGYGVNEAADRSWQSGLGPIGANTDVEGAQTRIVSGDAPVHPRPTLSFLQELLSNHPEIAGFQTPSNPTRDQQAQMLAVAIELMNQGLTDRGQPPVELGSQGTAGLRDFMSSQGRTPQHIANAAAQKSKEAQKTISGFPSPVRDMLSPDAPQQIAENPRGQLNPWVSALLSRTGFGPDEEKQRNKGITRSEHVARLRTDQANALLGAGPERSSLLGNLSPGEGAFARQMGGVDEFLTQFPGGSVEDRLLADLDRTNPGASRHFLPEAALPPPAPTAPLTRSGQSAEDIGDANRSIFSRLMASLPADFDDRSGMYGGTLGPPDASTPRTPPSSGLDFIGELLNAVEAQATPDNPEAELPPGRSGRLGRDMQRNLERSQWPAEPTPPTGIERGISAEADFPFPRPEFGPDMLEGNPNRTQTVGLDEAGNIRTGSPSGQILSGSLLEKILGGAGKLARGTGEAALGLAPNLLDMHSANNFAQALTGANQEYGGVAVPDSAGNLTSVQVDPFMAALYSMIPFTGLDRRRFQSDPQYRRQIIGPEFIPEIA